MGPEVIEEHRHQEWGYEKFIIQLCERPRTYILTKTLLHTQETKTLFAYILGNTVHFSEISYNSP